MSFFNYKSKSVITRLEMNFINQSKVYGNQYTLRSICYRPPCKIAYNSRLLIQLELLLQELFQIRSANMLALFFNKTLLKSHFLEKVILINITRRFFQLFDYNL